MITDLEDVRSMEAPVRLLNALLRSERSAVENFEYVIAQCGRNAPDELAVCMRSHSLRVHLLTMRVLELGGDPASSSGLWGYFVKVLEHGAALFGIRLALAALAEGEERTLTLYHEQIADLDLDARSLRLLETELLPEQLSTRDTIVELCRSIPSSVSLDS